MSSRTFGTSSGVSAGRLGKYQLDVTARTVVDVVSSAGGWLFDRAMAGWDVRVVVTDDCDLRPLRILGVSTGFRELDEDSSAPTRALAIAASADAMDDDPDLRADVLRAMTRGIGDVLVWGSERPSGIERGVDPVEHELSAAARAFKGHALAAAGLPSAVEFTETFLGRTGFVGGYSDLTPSAATSFAQR